MDDLAYDQGQHWAYNSQYPHVFQLMCMSTHAGEILQWCCQQWGDPDKVMAFDNSHNRLTMRPTGHNNGWYPWGNTSVHIRSPQDAVLFKLTHR
jgi:hypothetical protein